MTVIFEDGFETGGLTLWTSNDNTVGDTVAASQEKYVRGTWSLKCTTNGGGGTEYGRVHKTLTRTELYCRAYVYVETNGIDAATDNMVFIRFREATSATTVAAAGWYNDGGTLKWRMYSLDGAGVVNTFGPTPETGRWYCVELYWLEHAAAGIARMWIDGVLICEELGKDTDNYGDCGYLALGIVQAVNTTSNVVYCDCLVVSDTYIGPLVTNIVTAVHVHSVGVLH